MDIHLIPSAHATAAERAAVDRVLGAPATSWQGGERSELDTRSVVNVSTPAPRARLLPALQAAQAGAGWISQGALNYICQRLGVPPAEAYGVASFYALLRTEPSPPRVAHVCDDIACRAAGAEATCAALTDRLGPEGKPSGDGVCTWRRSPCLGHCERGSAALVQVAGESPQEWILSPATTEGVLSALTSGTPATGVKAPRAGSPWAPQTQAEDRSGLKLLRRVGRVDPESLDDYRAQGGYAALRRALEIGPNGVLREVLDSKLVGRGGAAFPTGKKWEALARAPARPHFFVCNADESEPGTFKDRVLMEEDPFAVVEAMTIAGIATGCEQGYIYVRGEYPLAAARLEKAMAAARARGFLGERILGQDIQFDLTLYRGAGAYICGEETALFNSIEGLRGEPRNKPPFPTQVGLFGKPTGINNVETLVNVLDIISGGGPAHAAVGTAQSTGPKLFCVCGSVERPGLYEAPFGITLRQIIELAGGVRRSRKLQTVLLGGAAGTFLTADEIDVPLTFEGARAIGASIGSGVVMVFDDRADMQDMVLRIAAFFRDESCGQCVPCRVGTVRQEESLRRLAVGKAFGSRADEAALIGDIGRAMRDASICGLGHTAFLAVESALKKLKVFGENGK